MKFYSFACCSALLLSGGAAAATAAEKTAEDTKLRNLQAATRPPKASPTPPPTPGATRPPKPVPTDAPVTPSPTAASVQTIAETVCSMDDFFTLCSLIEMSPVISDMLNGDGTYTLFAANNAAFDVILNMVDLSDEEIMGLLLYHIAPNLLTYNELLQIAPGKIETSVPGASIDVNARDEVLLNGKVKITTRDIVASNGIIQVVDQVIIPEISAPTDSPTKVSTDSPTEAPVTPAPTLKPTEVITPEPTLKPTEAQVDTVTPTKAPVSLPNSAKPTPDASSKPPTSDTSKSPSSMWSGGHSTQAPTTRVSFIKPIGTSEPTATGETWGAFSKGGKSKSKTAKTGGKSSKNSAKSGKSSKAEEVQGKTDKGDGKPGYHAMGSVKQRLGDIDDSLNARFRADFNDASLARGPSFVATAMLAVAWYWQ